MTDGIVTFAYVSNIKRIFINVWINLDKSIASILEMVYTTVMCIICTQANVEFKIQVSLSIHSNSNFSDNNLAIFWNIERDLVFIKSNTMNNNAFSSSNIN